MLSNSIATLIVASSIVHAQSRPYDEDKVLQAIILKDAYPEPFTVSELKKVRLLAKDPEMMRAFLLDLSKKMYSKGSRDAEATKNLRNQIHWQTIIEFYEQWLPPSPSNRHKYASSQNLIIHRDPLVDPQEYMVSGARSEVLTIRYFKPSTPIRQVRDLIVARGGKGINNPMFPDIHGALGFSAFRMEDGEGHGFTFGLTPRGRTWPLIQDDFK